MYQRKRISIILIVILLFQIVLPIVATTKVIAIEEVNKEEQSVNEIETNLKTIKFGSYSNENIEENSEEIVKETSPILEASENISEAYLEWSELSEEDKQDTVEPRKEYIDISELQTNEQFVTSGTTIPEEYNLRDTLSEIKTESQGSNGNCYAYAGLNAIETNIALKTGTIYDFSEMHIEYMTSTLLGGSRTFDAGGNFQTVVKYSDDLKGPVLESEIANKNYTEDEYTLLKNAKPIVNITETIEFPTINKRYGYTEEELTEFRESVKTHIMENGSVYASIYFSESSNYYNSTTKGYSCLDTSVLTNHAVSIIGWDDSYSKDNFPAANKPSKDGAWIALNSHGSSFGNNGVFYISYEDNWVEYNMSGVVSTTNFIDTYGPKVELTNYTNENNSISATINVFDIGGSGVNASSLKYQWTQSTEQPTLESFTTTFTNGDTLSKTYADGEQWYLWILAYDTENNYSISGAVQELKFTDENFYNALCYVLSDSIISSKANEDGTYSIFMTKDEIKTIIKLDLSTGEYPADHTSDHINNINGIENFTNLEYLYLFGNNIKSVDNIKWPAKIKVIDLRGNYISEMKNTIFPEGLLTLGLEHISEFSIQLPESLEILNLDHSENLDFTNISFPSKLKKLSICYNNIKEIEKIKFPESLEELSIEENNVDNIDCLEILENLKVLNIRDNNIKDISVINNFQKLEQFCCYNNGIKNIKNVNFPNSIKNLYLSDNEIEDISNINWPENLEYLYLNNNKISNIDGFKVNNVGIVDMSDNNIVDLSNFESGANTISLANNKINTIEGIKWSNYTNTIILSNNEISNINNVEWPEQLDSLAINGNNIPGLNGVVWKENLRYLILSDNNISEIKNVTWPESLKALELVENNITDLSWIESGTNLLGVALNDNNIYNLESLSVLSKLQELHLDNNYIEDISPLENLSSLSSLNIKNQEIIKVVDNETTNIELPQIIKESTLNTSKVYTTYPTVLMKCSIDGQNVIFKTEDIGDIYVIIDGGNADGTTLLITNTNVESIDNPVYKIENKEELISFRETINSSVSNLSKITVKLMNDIDLGGYYDETAQGWTGEEWIPIGNKEHPFNCIFDGNGHKITGVYINSEEDYQGLFGYNSGTIKNLSLENSYIYSTGSYVGGITGCNYDKATIENCYNEAKVYGKYFVGGVTGGNNNPYSGEIKIVNCSNLGEIIGSSSIRRNHRENLDK